MGIKTKLAIRLFQKDNGLIPTGVVGNLTIDVMCDKLVGNSKIKIIDGDTFLWEGEKIRIYGYDAPEMNEPGYELAKIKLALILSSGVVTIERLAKDKYNRTVARVKVNQIDIAELFKE
ncbi:MAG: peptidoglycan-binding protein, partial [candidate division WOR-3 bacterium]|nr:peptidoglycan-binding protein [candidate division WOR-3 bacterium]